jgi:hypothetical protein
MKREKQIVVLTTKCASRALKDLAKKRRTTQAALLREALVDLAKKCGATINP